MGGRSVARPRKDPVLLSKGLDCIPRTVGSQQSLLRKGLTQSDQHVSKPSQAVTG